MKLHPASRFTVKRLREERRCKSEFGSDVPYDRFHDQRRIGHPPEGGEPELDLVLAEPADLVMVVLDLDTGRFDLAGHLATERE